VVSLTTRDFKRVVRMPAKRWEARRHAIVKRRLLQLGSGDWASLYTSLGPNRDLVGRSTAELARSSQGPMRASLVRASAYRDVSRPSGVVQTQVAGRVQGSGRSSVRDIAVAVNGRIEAVGRSFHLVGEAVESFSVMVPEASMRDGRNLVEVFEVVDGDRLVPLARS
jgi:hypothetical protein